MTILEALESVVGIDNVPSNVFEKVLIDLELTGADTYTISQKDLINAAAVGILNGILVSSVSEGGYSITYDLGAIRARLVALGAGPKVRGLQVW